MLAKMYTEIDVHVPPKYHEKIKSALIQERPLAVKVYLREEPNAKLWVTPGQMLKMRRNLNAGKNVLTLKMSRKQAQKNLAYEGGFLSGLLSLATKALPTLLTGLTGGILSGVVEKAIKGSGLYLGKKGYGTARVDIEGNGLVISPVDDEGINGLYLRHDGHIYRGKGILLGKNSPFKDIPVLGLIL